MDKKSHGFVQNSTPGIQEIFSCSDLNQDFERKIMKKDVFSHSLINLENYP